MASEQAQQPQPTGSPPIEGAFSTETSGEVGFGATKKRVRQQCFVYACEQPDGWVEVRLLNDRLLPSGDPKRISREELLQEYMPEPELFLAQVKPAMQELDGLVEKADQHRARGEFYSAEFEYKTALALDEEHVRSTFGLGLTYLEQREDAKADLVFRKLVTMDSAFQAEHKHLFNEFGIRLRKNRMFDNGVRFYQRAMEFCREPDEHLFYNLARTLCEMGEHAAAREHLEKALAINPDFSECNRLISYMERYSACPHDPAELAAEA